MPEVSVKVKNIVKRYGGFTAVAGLSFEMYGGECFGLLGPNGAGKTTTVKMLCCILPITEGEIEVCGLSARENPREIKAMLGVCPQDMSLDPDFNVERNLLVYARYFGIPKHEAKRRADELIRQFHLEDKSGKPIDELSGGLKKRVAIARSLINRPSLLVLDEPSTGLDPQSRRQIWDAVNALKKEGITILLTTHYMEEASMLCDRLIVVDGGRIIEQGTPAGLLAKHACANLEDVYIKLTGKQLRE